MWVLIPPRIPYEFQGRVYYILVVDQKRNVPENYQDSPEELLPKGGF